MTTEHLQLSRTTSEEFESGRAECVICGAYVRRGGEMTQMLVRRRFGPGAVAGQCPVCDMVTFFTLE